MQFHLSLFHNKQVIYYLADLARYLASVIKIAEVLGLILKYILRHSTSLFVMLFFICHLPVNVTLYTARMHLMKAAS